MAIGVQWERYDWTRTGACVVNEHCLGIPGRVQDRSCFEGSPTRRRSLFRNKNCLSIVAYDLIVLLQRISHPLIVTRTILYSRPECRSFFPGSYLRKVALATRSMSDAKGHTSSRFIQAWHNHHSRLWLRSIASKASTLEASTYHLMSLPQSLGSWS